MCRKSNKSGQLMRYNKILKKLIDLIFVFPFDDKDTSKKLHEVIPRLSTGDTNIIKQEIQKQFGVEINGNISNMTLDEICKQVFANQNKKMLFWRSIFQNTKYTYYFKTKLTALYTNFCKLITKNKNKTTPPSQKPLLNSHEVFALVLSALHDVVGRRIYPSEYIKNLQSEFTAAGGEDFNAALTKSLQNIFHETMNITTDAQSNPRLAVYNISNQVQNFLIEHGKALAPEVECANMDPKWIPLRTAMTFNTVVKELNTKFGIWASTKTISNLKFYQEYENYVIKLVVKTKIDDILLGADKEYKRQAHSDTVISAQHAESITEQIYNVFNVKVDYDISWTKIDTLCKYVRGKVVHSKALRNKLFGTPNANAQSNTTPPKTEKLKTREKVFEHIIREFNRVVSLGRSVQRHTNVYDLVRLVSNDPQKTDKLQQLLDSLAEEYKVDIYDPNLTIQQVADKVHTVMVERGESESIYVALEDMDPIWATLNPPITFAFLRNVLLHNYGVSISVYKLSNCRTYDDYVKLITDAQARKAKDKTR